MAEEPTTVPWPQSPPAPGEIVVAPQGRFAITAARHLAALIGDLAKERDSVSIALAGGNTPRSVYGALASLDLVPWDRVEVFFGDERAVPQADPRSNYRMARESLLDRVRIPAARVHRMRCDAASLTSAARAYASELPRTLDLVLLGVGPDGHTASLFPGADALRSGESVVPAVSPLPPRERLTLTPRVLVQAREIVVLASGSEKAGPVARAVAGPWDPQGCPAQLARRGTWLLDSAAAADLPASVQGLRSTEALR